MYRVLAWSDGPAEDVPADRLSGSQQLFIAQGPLGPRLVSVKPIEREGRRIGMAAAEAVLSPPTRVGLDDNRFDTSFGPVSISQLYGGAVEPAPGEDRFFVSGADGPLLEVQFSSADLAAQRQAFRRRELAIAALPLVLALLLSSAPMLDRRRGARDAREFDRWSMITAAAVLLGAVVLTALAAYVGAPLSLTEGILGLAAVALAYLFPVSWWWRRERRRFPARAPARFATEQLLGGLALGAALLAASWIAATRMPETALNRWHSSLFPIEGASLLTLSALRLTELAIGWTAAALLAWLAARWRLSWRHGGMGLAAAVLWTIAPALVIALRGPWPPVPLTAALPVAAAATFALLGVSLRSYYRRTTQAMRLVLVFGAMVLPSIALYPISAFHAERQARHLIESTYAPAVAQHPSALQEQMARAQAEIDRLPNLVTLVSTPPPAGLAVQSQSAFLVWSQTNLSRARATSEIELYGPDTELVSRFALNVPEYQSPVSVESWPGTSCQWEVYSEIKRFGADDRLMWHARRSVCDTAGQFLGGVVVHVLPDYRSLPFIASASPYREVLASGDDDSALADVPELAVVVYGWSRSPLFTSSDVAWSVAENLAAQMQAARTPFWRDLPADNREYHVYFAKDRAGIYALGYPAPTSFEHATRLAEIAAMIACSSSSCCSARWSTRRWRAAEAPLRVLFHEIRTSFYRKLFLFFVLVAIGPVLLFALAFGAYMTTQVPRRRRSRSRERRHRRAPRLRAGRPPQQHPDQPQAPPTDDVMVWIRQVIDQDVNLFEGSELVATSQRDLFDSGLLPTRTPAVLYRRIALDRLPTVVDGPARRVPVPGRGRARSGARSRRRPERAARVRQREIEREIDELNRGVLVGSVVVVLFAAGLGASVAGRVSDPVARLTRATRLIAAGRLDVRIAADTADELRRLVDDFNTMTATLVAQRARARAHQSAQGVERNGAAGRARNQEPADARSSSPPSTCSACTTIEGRPLGAVFDQCVDDDPRPGPAAPPDCLGVRELRRRADSRGSSAVAAAGAGRRTIVDAVPAPASRLRRCEIADRRPSLPAVSRRSHAAGARADQPRRERDSGDAGRRHAPRSAPRSRGDRRSTLTVGGHRRRDGRGGARARVRAVLLDQDRRLGPRPREREAERRALRRHDRARERARPRHDGDDHAAGGGSSRCARNRVSPSSTNADSR